MNQMNLKELANIFMMTIIKKITKSIPASNEWKMDVYLNRNDINIVFLHYII